MEVIFGFAGYLSNVNEANFEVGLPLDISTWSGKC